jgi:hypothetical protein
MRFCFEMTTETVIRRFDHRGVLLCYFPDRLGRHHLEQRHQPGDRLRCSILRAEREIRCMRIMIECIEEALSEVAVDRFAFGLHTVEVTLSLARDELGLSVADENSHGE